MSSPPQYTPVYTNQPQTGIVLQGSVVSLDVEKGMPHLPCAEGQWNNTRTFEKIESEEFHTRECWTAFWRGCGLILLWELLAFLAFLLVSFLGLLIGALAPSVILLGRARKSYFQQVFASEMARTFLRACVFMLPLTFVLVIYLSFIEPEMNLKDKGSCSMCWFSYAFSSFVLAGLLEESLKFFAIYSIRNKPYVADYRSWMVYGVCAGAGFATIENMLYVFSSSIATAFTRAFLSVPLHMFCGAIIALKLFEQLESEEATGYQKAISGQFDHASSPNQSATNNTDLLKRLLSCSYISILVHGFYDFGLFFGFGVNTSASIAVGLILCLSAFAFGIVYLRQLTIAFAARYPKIDVHGLVLSKRIDSPDENVCCCISFPLEAKAEEQ